MKSFTYLKKGKKRCEMRRAKEKGISRKVIGALAAVILCFFLLYGISPFGEKGLSFGFSAFAYTCTVSSITESSNYAYASGTDVYYTNIGTGIFTTNINAAVTNGVDCYTPNNGSGIVYNVSFPFTVSAEGYDTASPWAWDYTFDSGDTSPYTSETVTCYYKCTDAFSIWYPSITSTNNFNVYYDGTAPTVGAPTLYSGTRTGDSSGSYFKGTVSARATISDSGSGLAASTCQVSINSGAYTSTGVTQDASYCYYNNYAPGATFTIAFRVNDNVGTTGTSSTSTFNYDGTAPTTNVSAVYQGTSTPYTFGAWINKNVTVTSPASCSDSGSGCYATHACGDYANTCTPSSNPLPIDFTCTLGSVCTGYIRYNSSDNLNNYEATKSSTIKMDMQNPTTSATATSPPGGASYTFGNWTASDIQTTLSCSDGSGSGCSSTQYCTDTINSCTPSTAYSSPYTISCTAGNVCLQYTRYNSTDAVGNTEGIKSSTTRIDKQLPTTNINPNGQSCSATQPSVNLSCSDSSGSGCSTTYYKIVSSATTCDSSGMSTYSGAFSVTCTAGTYCTKKICTYSTDAVGNSESVVTSSIYYIDLAAPNAPTGLTPAGGTCTATAAPTLSWTAPSDNGCSSVAGYQVELYSSADCSGTAIQTGTPSSNSWTPSALSTGAYSWRAKAKDALNNWGSWSSCTTLNIDTSAPSTTINPDGRAWGKTDVTGITISPTQIGCAAASGTYYKIVSSGTTCDSTGMSTYSGAFNVTCAAGSACTQKVCYYSTDSLGNTESVKTSNIYYIDKQNPICSISSISKDSGAQYEYVSGTTIYYGNSGSNTGSFTVNVSASDASGSGVSSVYFPDTVSVGANDSSVPYSVQYSWDSSDTYSQAATVTAYDNVNNTNTCTFTVTRDTAVPSGGSISYFNGITSQTNQQINVSAGTDSGSGLATAQLYRQNAILTGTSCGSYGSFTAVGNSSTSKTYVIDTLGSGYCYKYIYNVTDNVGNVVSYSSSNEIKVDTSTPAITFVSPTDSDSAKVSRNWTYINITADKTLTSAILEWNGSNESMSGSGTNWYKNKTLLSQGVYTYKVYGNDSANNWGVSQTRSITIDWTAPSTTPNPNGQSCSANQPSVTLSCSDSSGSGCNTTYYKTVGSATTCDSTGMSTYSGAFSVTCTAGTYCTKKICTYSTDLAGNSESVVTSSIYYIDLAGPNIPGSLSPANATWTKDSTPTFSWSAPSDNGCSAVANYNFTIYSDAACTLVVQSNSTSLTSYTPSALSDGNYYWKVKASDALGNFGNWSACTEINIDATAPTTSFIPSSQSCSQTQPDINLSCSDSTGSGCNTTYYKTVDSSTTCNTTGMSTYSSQFSINCTAGNYCSQKVCAYSTDNLGNIESVASSGNYLTDLAGPNAPSGLLPANNTMTSDDTPAFSWTAPSDVGCGSIADYNITIYSNSACSNIVQSSITSSANYTATTMPENDYWWKVKARDSLGNWGQWSSCIKLTIHTSGPNCTVSAINESSSFAYSSGNIVYYNNRSSGSYNVTADVLDSGSGIKNATFPDTTSAGGAVSSSPYEWQYSWDSAASYSQQATIYVYDNLSNSENCSFIVTLDNSNPLVNISGAPPAWQSASASINLSCSDSGSGCDSSMRYYYLNGTGAYCPEFSISEYTQYSSPVVISSHLWFCGYVADKVNNSNLSSPAEILVDQAPPTSSITSPDAGSWFSSDFNVSMANSDPGGSGLNKCYYKVVSNGTETLPYTEHACNSNITITVGSGMNCRDQGINACEVDVYATDNAGNSGSAVSRDFSIEITAPQIIIVDPGCSYEEFAVDYSISNVGSGLSSCTYEWSLDGDSWNSTGFSSGTCLEGDNSVNFNSSLCRNNDFGSCIIRINATTIASSTGSGNLSISVDNKAPTISIDATSSTYGWYKNGSVMNITSSVAANGCLADSCYYALSNENGTSYESWNSMPCNSVQPFESGMDCTAEGIDKCRVKVYANESAHQGNVAEMTGAWDIDFTPPITTDNVAVPPWDNWIVYLDTYYATYYSNITLNCSDSASGCNSTFYCTYSPDNESQCSPSTEAYSNPAMINVSCPFNSVCKNAVRYYSTDTAGNYENVKESPVVYIVSNSYVNNTNVSDSQIINESDIRYSNIENSTVDGCYVRNSVIINSMLKNDPNYDKKCRIVNSVVIGSVLISSESIGSTLNGTYSKGSHIEGSSIENSVADYSTIANSSMPCGGFAFYNAGVNENILASGAVSYGSYTYYAPKNLSSICSGVLPRPVGTLSALPSLFSNSTTITLLYRGVDTGFYVSVNTSPINYDGGNVVLKDDGILPDESKDDAIYTANITVNMDGDSAKLLSARIVDLVGNVFYTNTSVILDNTKPNAVITINGGDSTTITRHVVLNLQYSDANGVKQCRYANEDLNWTDWEPCSSTKAWVLSAGNGTKTVNYEVMDNAGNNQSDLDIITLQEGAYDLTPPTNLIVTDDGDYTDSATTLHARWSAFDRESKVFYLYRINSSGSCVPIDGSCGWQDALDSTEATVTNLSLEEGHTYKFCVIAQNAYFINSSEVCSDGIIVDLTPPEISSLYSSFAEGVWTNSSSPYFSWNATDPVSAGISSGVYAYSYVLDENSNTTPDIVPEGDLGALANETYKLYSSLVDGVHYFHVRARDAAGNWGPASHYEIKSDITPPTIPFMLSPNQSTNSSTITFNWEPSTDYSSGVAGYYITITRADTGEYLADNLWIGNVTHYDASAINGITYHASVKAKDSAGNIGLDSDLAGGTYDNQAPIILFKKPNVLETVVSNQPILTIDTDEIATCYYEGVIFAYTDSTHHEAKVTVLNGQSPSFNIICRDLVGNQASASISFSVDSTLVATGVNVLSSESVFYANLPVSFVIEAKSAGDIMGEIPKERFSVLINGTIIDDFVVKDNGGNYTITFLAPAVEGTYSVVFRVDSAQSSAAEMPVENLNMIITYDSSLSGTVTNDKMAYSDESSHIVGIASDSRDVSASGSSAQLQVVAESSGNAYIFVTRQGENPGSRENYLKSQKFIGLPSSSFGYRVSTDKYIINTELKYKDIAVSSDRSIGPGAHTLVIRNNGLTPDGRVNVTISTD